MAVAIALMMLVGCAKDPRQVIGPDVAAKERFAASEAVSTPTTLNGPGLANVASRVVDECGVDATGLQPADVPRTYRCGIGRVALYSVTGASPTDAATIIDSAMAARACTSSNPVSSDPAALAAVEAAPDGATQAIRTYYECGEFGTQVIFGLSTDMNIGFDLPALPPRPSGTAIISDPPLDADDLADATRGGNRFVLILNASIDYFNADVCDGLHRC